MCLCHFSTRTLFWLDQSVRCWYCELSMISFQQATESSHSECSSVQRNCLLIVDHSLYETSLVQWRHTLASGLTSNTTTFNRLSSWTVFVKSDVKRTSRSRNRWISFWLDWNSSEQHEKHWLLLYGVYWLAFSVCGQIFLSERKIMKHPGTSSEIYKKYVAGSSMKATGNYHL